MKKQLLTIRMLLVVAMLCLGVNVSWADRVYFNDFSTGDGTTAPDGLTIHGGGTFVDDADAKFGKVFQNVGGALRTNYLQLPNDLFDHSATSQELTIGFWVNKKEATGTYSSATPLFTAYGSSTSTSWPMFRCSLGGNLQLNHNGYCDFGNDLNDASTNSEDITWINDKKWHYYTVVFTATTAKVYVDGSVVNSWTVDGTSAGQVFSGMLNNAEDGSGNKYAYFCLGGNQAWDWGITADQDPAFAFDDFAIYDEALTPAQIVNVIADKKSLTVETYDFAAANTTSNSSECTYGATVKINNTDCNTLSSARLEMNDRFAGQVANGSKWYVYRSSSGFGTSTDRKFGILNLTEDDYVSITFTGSAPTFIGNSNISGKANGTAVVSGELYKMSASGNLELSVLKSASSSYTYIKSISIYTSKPVLSKPTITFNGMVESAGVYNPKYTFSSTDDGVTFYDGDGNDISSGYTFTAAGTLTYYAGKTGHTNSAKQTYTVTANQVGMILTNSIDVQDLYDVTGLSADKGFYSGLSYDLIPNVAISRDNDSNGAVYRGKHSSTTFNAYYARNKAFTATCSNLSEEEVVVFADYTGNVYVPCTSTNNVTTVAKDKTIKYYFLYTQPTLTQSITVSAAEWKTLVSPYSLDFTSVEGLKAYIVTGGANSKLTKTQVKKVPAGTALLLNGSATTYNVPVIAKSAATDDVADNKLIGVVTNKEIPAEAGYVLMASPTLGFYKNANEFTVGAFTAYLPIDFDANTTEARKSFMLDEVETTGIKTVQASGLKANGYYDLQGRRVSQPTKGMYIMNGKKVVIK